MSARERQVILWAFLIAAATVVVYAGVWSFEFIQLDDPTYITHNANIAGGLTWSGIAWAFTSGYAANWHPLTWISHMLDIQLFGMNAGPAHLVNLVLHLANALLLFRLLMSMTGAAGRSALVAALFAVHPLHVESVAWISERKDVLSTLFWLLTTIAYVRWIRRPTRLGYAAVVLLFALGLMAKPMLVTLPFTLLLLDVWPLRRPVGSADHSSIRPTYLMIEKWPLFALAALSCVATFVAQKSGGAVMTLGKLSLVSRVENAFVSYVRYVAKTFWPTDLVVYYPPHPWPLWQALVSAAAVAAVTIVALRSLRATSPFGVGWLWFAGTLAPVIGLVQVGRQAMADRYTYVPMIGLLIIVVWGAHDLLARARASRWPLALLGVAVVGVTGIRAHAQVGHWQNDQALWTHEISACLNLDERRAALVVSDLLSENTLEELQALVETQAGSVRPPASAIARQAVGRHFLRHRQVDDAARTFAEAVLIDPNLAEAHSDLGLALSQQGRQEEAASAYREALRLNPNLAETHNDFGFVLAQQGRLTEAAVHFADAVRLRPNLVDAWRNLGLALANLGRFEEAIAALKEALRLNPNDASVRQALTELQKRTGKTPDRGSP